jgi:hypothetical protein
VQIVFHAVSHKAGGFLELLVGVIVGYSDPLLIPNTITFFVCLVLMHDGISDREW